MKACSIIVLMICLSCAHEIVEIQTPSVLTVVTDENNLFLEMAWNLAWRPHAVEAKIDQFYRLNPKSFALTDRELSNTSQSKRGQYIRSSITGNIYKCSLKKGDKIFLPRR